MDYGYNLSDVDSLRLYLNDISEYKVLSNEETIELIKKAQKGDEEARNKIIENNLKLVVSIAKKHANSSQSMTLLDLIEYGNLAIFSAIRNFDVNGKVKFSTYLATCIDGSLRNAKVKECTMLNYSNLRYYTVGKIKSFCDRFLILNEREATDEEIKKELNVNQEIINLYRLTNESQLVSSLDAPCLDRLDKSDVTTFYDLIGKNDENIESANDKLTIKDIVSIINELPIKERNKNIVLYRYGIKDGNYHSLSETGEEYGVNRERVRQIEISVLKRVKRRYRINDNR